DTTQRPEAQETADVYLGELPTVPSQAEETSKPLNLGFFIFTALILSVLVFFLVSLFSHHMQIKEDATQAPTRRVQDLVSLLSQAEEKQKKLSTEVAKLRQLVGQDPTTIPAPLPKASENLTNLSAPETQIESSGPPPNYNKLLELGGLTVVKGPGIILTLNESANPVQGNTGKRSAEVQNSLPSEDLLKLFNDLKAAGASSISINNQRIVTHTEIVNAGPSIVVNQTRIAPPFEIKALGNPPVLDAALTLRGGILEYLQFFGIQSHIRQKKEVILPAYSGTLP
ncbi:MAG: DUF881 domain-containing protein, partial [Cyanobacteria bacterium]|nr:DUF881 domain-containing protein [Cyanobacteriota bacterium]